MTELWHHVEARRDDGAASMFRIRELEPRSELPKINVVELPYATTEQSRLPTMAAHRRIAEFEELWLRPACTALGCELVGTKTEDGACFFYVYGVIGPEPLIAKLAAFDAALAFYDDDDPTWSEYATLRELLDQARAMSDHDHGDDHDANPPTLVDKPKPRTRRKPKPARTPRRKPKPKSKPRR